MRSKSSGHYMDIATCSLAMSTKKKARNTDPEEKVRIDRYRREEPPVKQQGTGR